METFSLIFVWFCVGWTIITFPGVVILFLFSLWADYENAKHQEKMKQLLTEDKESE